MLVKFLLLYVQRFAFFFFFFFFFLPPPAMFYALKVGLNGSVYVCVRVPCSIYLCFAYFEFLLIG